MRTDTTPMNRTRRRSLLRSLALALCLAAAPFAGAACASGGGGSGGGGGSVGELERPSVGTIRPGDPVHGEVAVTWKNLNPRNPDVTQILVNESSQYGKALASGRTTSSEVRLLSDADMGTLLQKLRELGFFEHATRGVGVTNIPQVVGRRGIVVVHDNGTDWGLMLAPGAGDTRIPETYRDCKGLILAVHGAVQGLEVRTDLSDPERVFSAPPIRMDRR